MRDAELFELINYFPSDAAWILQMHRRGLGDQYVKVPNSDWCQWACALLSNSTTDNEGVDVLLRLLKLAELLYPGGMESVRLEESLSYLFDSLLSWSTSQVKRYPIEVINFALQQRLIREDQVDLWRQGMPSGQGWRTYYKLTLNGKAAVDFSSMPLVEDVSKRNTNKALSWWPQAKPNLPVNAQKVDQQADRGTHFSLPDDFVWTKPYVDQQVNCFFKHHSKIYSKMAMDVLNTKLEMNQFVSEFGPAKISQWINKKHHVRKDHPNPCKPQNINNSVTYEACVKSFKRKPDKHPIAKLLYQAESSEVEKIMQELLGEGRLI